jgi:hypothetical protein
MKNLLVLLATALLSINATAEEKYGKKFDASKATDVPGFVTAMQGKDKIDNVVVRGTITEVCQVAGCWVKLKNNLGDDLFVKFREVDGNHELVLPKDYAGKTVVVYGKGSMKTISVEQRRHYAEDAGATEAEAAKITEPTQQLRIDATGVIVEK